MCYMNQWYELELTILLLFCSAIQSASIASTDVEIDVATVHTLASSLPAEDVKRAAQPQRLPIRFPDLASEVFPAGRPTQTFDQ